MDVESGGGILTQQAALWTAALNVPDQPPGFHYLSELSSLPLA